MSCISTFGRIFLVVFNVIFLVLGLAMLIVGIIFKVDANIILSSDIFNEDLRPLLEKVSLPGGLDLIGLLQSLSLFVIILGAVIFILGFLGCCGACCKIRWMLVLYAIFVLLILIAQVALVVLFAIVRNDAEREIRKTFTDELKSYKTDTDLTDDISNAYNYMFTTIHCCGVNNYTDMENTPWYQNAATKPSQTYPRTCCKNLDQTALSTGKCDSEGFYEQGCYNVMKDDVLKYSTVFIGVGSGLLAFELLCVIFAFCVCNDVQKEAIV